MYRIINIRLKLIIRNISRHIMISIRAGIRHCNGMASNDAAFRRRLLRMSVCLFSTSLAFAPSVSRTDSICAELSIAAILLVPPSGKPVSSINASSLCDRHTVLKESIVKNSTITYEIIFLCLKIRLYIHTAFFITNLGFIITLFSFILK